MKRQLLDASSLMLLMKIAEIKIVLNYLRTSCILDLTFYEVGNAIWKETCLAKFLTKKESEILRDRVEIVLSKIDKIISEKDNFQGIFDFSEMENLSFYDASYLFVAKEKGFVLVTEDKELKAKGKKHVEVQNVSDLIA